MMSDDLAGEPLEDRLGRVTGELGSIAERSAIRESAWTLVRSPTRCTRCRRAAPRFAA